MFQCTVLGRLLTARLALLIVAAAACVSNSFAQSIMREYWLGIPGAAVSDLTGNPAFPNSPTGRDFPQIFEGPQSYAENYGTRFRGFVKPPTSGNYTFWIAGDDNCELWLSTDATTGNRRLIARVLTWTSSRVWEEPRDGNSAAQRSAAIPLVGGQKYYIEALHKEGGGGDNIAVGWQLPNGTLERPIPGSRLEAYQAATTPPVITDEPDDITVREGAEARFTVSATGLEPMTFQWRRNGAELPIERSATLIIPRAQLYDTDTTFDCVIVNDRGTATTRTARLTVLPENTPPVITALTPPAGTAVRQLKKVEVSLSEAVAGVDASDLLVNNVPATSVSGQASGPYIFEFTEPAGGPVVFSWAQNHGITDLSQLANPFAGGTWNVTLNPALPPPQIRITEIMASNETGIVDEDLEAQDWIEIHNYGTASVNLNGYSLSDDRNIPGLWVFPNWTLSPGARLVVFASGKDRKAPTGNQRFHTNFQLGQGGEFLALYDNESPRNVISALDEYPEQRVNISYGLNAQNEWRYYSAPTPGAANGVSDIVGILPPPHFSLKRGFYPNGITLHLTTDVPDAQIRFTINGGDPVTAPNTIYQNPITINTTLSVRAALFKPGYLPSATETHSYVLSMTAARRNIPAMVISTAGTNYTGPTGIVGINGGSYASGVWQPVNPGDYHNPSQHGIQWERPVSAEFFYPSNNTGVQIDCGIRVQGSDYIRPRYTTGSKFSYRLYFRGDYGKGKLEFPLFEDSAVKAFDQLVLRAGHNDESNPFIKDELMRRLFIDCGQVGSRGNFVSLFLNNAYKGYFNVCERIEKNFCQAWHGGSDQWDVIAQGLDPLDGDSSNFQSMRAFITGQPMSNAGNYAQAAQKLDLVNFIDYLLVNIYGANGDWPHNNWRAARERVATGIWRFYIWDAEFALGTYGRTPQYDSFANELSATSEIASIYRALMASPEFKLLFADRIQKHFFNGGALTDENVRRNYDVLAATMSPLITGFDGYIGNTWIPQRRTTLMQHFSANGVLSVNGAPTMNQVGGRVPAGFLLTMNTIAAGATVYYTTDGSDPRVMFTGAISPSARAYVVGTPLRLTENVVVKARTRTSAGAWTALTEGKFEVAEFGAPLRFTEVMFNSPPNGDSLDFIEMKNFGNATLDVSGMEFDGVSFRFPENSRIAPGEVFVIASGADPAAFAARYPDANVRGYYSNNLNNGGELIRLLDRFNNIVAWVNYDDEGAWPAGADGQGYSLELVARDLDPNNAGSWRRSSAILGSPGVYNPAPAPTVRFNEVMVRNGTTAGWIELQNTGASDMNLGGYVLSVIESGRRYTFPPNTIVPSAEYLIVQCDLGGAADVLHSGFELSAIGASLLLSDPAGNRIDAIDFGRQVLNHSIGLESGVWSLNSPTRGAANVRASVTPATDIYINEFMANPLPGADDWIELHNRGTVPAALRGMTLNVGGSFFRIPTLSFIPAGGFLQLLANESPQRERLNFKLPAIGAVIRLYDANGTSVNSITYTNSLENVSEGRLPDASATVVRFRGTSSPGASNYNLTGTSLFVINEVMARNVRAFIDPFGGAADWVEFYNSGNQPVSLTGLALSTDIAEPAQWRFPDGLSIPAQNYLVVWFDKTHPPRSQLTGPLNTGHSISAEGGGVYLFNDRGQVIDQVEFGWQVPDLSIGKVGPNWNLTDRPTPGAANTGTPVFGSASAVRINEWSAETASQPAWVEVVNTTALPVALAGMSLTDDLSWAGLKKFVFPPLTFVGGNSVIHFETDDGIRPGTVSFNVAGMGEGLRMYSFTQTAATVVDSVYFGRMPNGSTLGRFPDGAGNPMQLASSRGTANYKPLAGVVINEVFPADGKVELRNTTTADIDVGTWNLTDNPFVPARMTFPSPTIVPARGYAIVAPTGFNLDSSFGGSLALIAQPSRDQTRFQYGAAQPGDSYGRWPTSLGIIEPLLLDATLGAANTYPAFGPVIIREIMYHPAPSLTSAEADLEYIELWNPTPFAVEAFDWRIAGGIDFNLPPDFRLGANGLVVIVAFDPAAEPSKLAAFQTRYPYANGARILGPFRGRLNNRSDTVELLRPTAPDARGYIPHIAVDRVAYADTAPWPVAADGEGKALHRLSGFGEDAFNWYEGDPTPGGRPEFDSIRDTDEDGITDSTEIAFGLNLNDPSDATLDGDGDGISNRDEIMVGTDPTDPASAGFRIETNWNEAGPNIQFNALAGARYEIQFRDDLSAGQWERHSVVGPFETAGAYSFQALAPDKTQRFYRVVHGPAN